MWEGVAGMLRAAAFPRIPELGKGGGAFIPLHHIRRPGKVFPNRPSACFFLLDLRLHIKGSACGTSQACQNLRFSLAPAGWLAGLLAI
uniref:Uncharacterized protein n=1 Tax=Physcomitrium patens TaxID=3218 RepID=A0A2K1KK52_PHYPA|nr:hypothetical protein PHYPA_007837 [Physcomitrium patens]